MVELPASYAEFHSGCVCCFNGSLPCINRSTVLNNMARQVEPRYRRPWEPHPIHGIGGKRLIQQLDSSREAIPKSCPEFGLFFTPPCHGWNSFLHRLSNSTLTVQFFPAMTMPEVDGGNLHRFGCILRTLRHPLTRYEMCLDI